MPVMSVVSCRTRSISSILKGILDDGRTRVEAKGRVSGAEWLLNEAPCFDGMCNDKGSGDTLRTQRIIGADLDKGSIDSEGFSWWLLSTLLGGRVCRVFLVEGLVEAIINLSSNVDACCESLPSCAAAWAATAAKNCPPLAVLSLGTTFVRNDLGTSRVKVETAFSEETLPRRKRGGDEVKRDV
mmetsp:Transcript_32833/g.86291  ORF Transcript_32833/g.86291 Transcript_32833/m.86291 type:complete len:184 (+) Transcript_32833:788-1339(+)